MQLYYLNWKHWCVFTKDVYLYSDYWDINIGSFLTLSFLCILFFCSLHFIFTNYHIECISSEETMILRQYNLKSFFVIEISAWFSVMAELVNCRVLMSVRSLTGFWLVNCSRIQQVRNSYTEALASTNPKTKFMCYLLSEQSTWISRIFYSFCISGNTVYMRGSEQ